MVPLIRVAIRNSTTVPQTPIEKAKMLQNFNPKNYSVPVRLVSMDDCLEPYGSWKIAYAAEKKKANRVLFAGIVCISATLTFVYHSGVLDPLVMPNLDNIMEETEPFEFDKEDRITV